MTSFNTSSRAIAEYTFFVGRKRDYEELSAVDLNTRTSLGDTQKDLKNLGKLVAKVET